MFRLFSSLLSAASAPLPHAWCTYRYREQAELYAAREAIFGMPRTEHPSLDVIAKTIEPAASLWRVR
jgi:hypothetical protein